MRARRPFPRQGSHGARLQVLSAAALMAMLWLTACSTSSTGTSSGASKPAFVQTQTAGNYAVTLRVSPAKFGYNTFSVSLKDSNSGTPVNNATVQIFTTMLDMDMGTQSTSLHPASGASQGVYSGGGELSMAGNWQLAVKVTPPSPAQSFAVNFHIVTTYS
jgi:YtkA-like